MTEPQLNPCGLYRTREPIGDIPAGALVYFHNHGDPGPGIYLPLKWTYNRVQFHQEGMTISADLAGTALEPLLPEGYYRVAEEFYCCADRCRRFEGDSLVQLGYDAAATPILFVPELLGGLLVVPEIGTALDRAHLESLRPLKVPMSQEPPTEKH